MIQTFWPGNNKPNTRSNPKEAYGLQRGQLLRLEVEVCGTDRGSANSRETTRQYILELVQTHALLNPKQLQNPFYDSEWLT